MSTRLHALLLIVVLSGSTAGCAMVDHLTGEDVNREVREQGQPARAQVLEIWETGVTLNDSPVVGFRLRVEAEGRPPWEAESRAVVSLLAIPRIQPGSWVEVRFDPADLNRVAIVGTTGSEPGGGPAPPRPTLGDDLEVTPLADGVWLHVSYQQMRDYGRVPANGLIVVTGTQAALIDTPWTNDQTGRLIDWIRAELGVQVTVVVPSHFHQDCMGGLAAAHAAGARSYASMATGRFAADAGLEAPQHLFSDRLQLRLGTRALGLHFAGPGHTNDTIVVWLDDVQVLFAGDLARSATATNLGNTAEADLDRWPATVATLLEEYPTARIVVPGHGRPGGRELLEHTLELLAAQETGGNGAAGMQ